MIVEALVCRSGWHDHDDSDAGRQLRPRGEVHAIAAQLPGKPVCIGHPKDADHQPALLRLDSETIVGRVLSARVVKIDADTDHDYVLCRLEIDDERGMPALRQQKYFSLGYDAIVIDGVQRATRVDHIAIGQAPRGGRLCTYGRYVEPAPVARIDAAEVAAIERTRVDSVERERARSKRERWQRRIATPTRTRWW